MHISLLLCETAIFLSFSGKSRISVRVFSCLTFYSIIAPFDTFEISCIGKYYEKWSIFSFGANASFSVIFSIVFEASLKFLFDFFNIF